MPLALGYPALPGYEEDFTDKQSLHSMKVTHSKLLSAVVKGNTVRKMLLLKKKNQSRGVENELVLSRVEPDKRNLHLLSEHLHV